jgi:hypothetical protein
MVKLTEVEDEHFSEKPATTKDDALFEDDDDYTDTGMSFPFLSRTVYCQYQHHQDALASTQQIATEYRAKATPSTFQWCPDYISSWLASHLC